MLEKNKEGNFDRETLITSGFILVCLLLYAIFPAGNIFEQVISSLVFLLLLPFLYVKIILKKEIKNYGIQKGDWIPGIFWSLVSIGIALSLVYLLANYADFFRKYSLPQIVRANFIFFLGYEFLLVGFFSALYEIFFRGFLMFSFSGRWGYFSILLQSAIFFLLFFVSSSFSWSVAPYLIFSIFGGIIAFRSRSIIYSFAANFVFLVILDSIFIKLAK